ncbi:hypothetical protein DEU56DRAFT_840165 [Suillus clintonianus]|uniref:uncharacterized protein n=1 Tax=Suillus clintonianus TaxID=1904413 RepID=UPI001B87C06A|nr:uncharacterized protein DEU56DRAFT_840165 [Suillus clintonianus]KAG2116378.1 hypothetical protein DEU56DRAFT_840165 [Suillus clintonianus]
MTYARSFLPECDQAARYTIMLCYMHYHSQSHATLAIALLKEFKKGIDVRSSAEAEQLFRASWPVSLQSMQLWKNRHFLFSSHISGASRHLFDSDLPPPLFVSPSSESCSSFFYDPCSFCFWCFWRGQHERVRLQESGWHDRNRRREEQVCRDIIRVRLDCVLNDASYSAVADSMRVLCTAAQAGKWDWGVAILTRSCRACRGRDAAVTRRDAQLTRPDAPLTRH